MRMGYRQLSQDGWAKQRYVPRCLYNSTDLHERSESPASWSASQRAKSLHTGTPRPIAKTVYECAYILKYELCSGASSADHFECLLGEIFSAVVYFEIIALIPRSQFTLSCPLSDSFSLLSPLFPLPYSKKGLRWMTLRSGDQLVYLRLKA